jgi:hypothetical protein
MVKTNKLHQSSCIGSVIIRHLGSDHIELVEVSTRRGRISVVSTISRVICVEQVGRPETRMSGGG